jgi:hypothetical protein
MFGWGMGKKEKRGNGDKWIYLDPSVRLPYFMMKSVAWRELSGSAQSLYCYMRMTVRDPDVKDDPNLNERRVRFGPGDVSFFGHGRYYRAMEELVKVGFVDEVVNGGHGRKGVYDLLTTRWIGWERRGRR